MAVYRLYLIDRDTGKKTGKKRDYPSVEHLFKYGFKTYKRYNREFYSTNNPTGTKAELCYLNKIGVWQKIDEKYIPDFLLTQD